MVVTNHLLRFLVTEQEKDQPLLLALLPTGVYRASTSRYCWCALTAPLHPYPHQLSVISYQLSTINCLLFTVYYLLFTEKGGIFLWHYPHDRSHWALPSKCGLSEARTFLKLQGVCNHLRLLFSFYSVIIICHLG